MRYFIATALIMMGGAAQANDLVECTTSIRGEQTRFFYDPDVAALRESRSWRDRNFGDWGAISCPGLVTLRAMTPELDDAGRAPFCLQWDRKAKTYIGYATGDRDAWMGCQAPSKSFCERVNGSKRAAAQIAGQTLGIAQAGLAMSQHPSGAVLMNGQGNAVGGRLVELGVSAFAGAASPAVLAGAAVTAVAVGGAVYVCSDEGAEGAAVQAAPVETVRTGAQVTGLPGSDLPVSVELSVGGADDPPASTESTTP